ncbi:MAG: M60 family metallopeptidase [Bacteroidaceae bacterium]|nr:M60 family metallopeptidase [Bacteroidaceae bacterium]
MKFKALLTSLLLLITGVVSAAITTGYYRIVSYNGKYMTENTNSHTLVCSDFIEGNYSQVWYLNISGTNVTFKNALTDKYIQGQASYSSQYSTGATQQTFVMAESEGKYTFEYDPYFKQGGGMHCSNENNVVEWYTSESKSQWTIEAADVDASALEAQKSATAEATVGQLTQFFTTTACTALKSNYAAMSDANLRNAMSALPTSVQDMAVKVKNNTWTTYSGWDKTELDFRVGSHKAYSHHDRWAGIIGCGYVMGRLSNPTGIYAQSGEYLYVYVGEIPSDQNVKLEVASAGQGAGVTYDLHEGMNTLLMATTGNCYVLYEVDNTTDGKAPYTAIDSYPAITVHIEGGTVQGYFDLTKGDDNDDWANLRQHLLKCPTTVELKTNNLLFHMTASLVTAACPTKMVELLGEWDKILDMEHSLMGLGEFDGYWNNMLSVTDMSGQDYMHASNYGTYYDVGTISSIMSYEDMFAGGALWGPAHENGHIFQKYINMVGQTEVSNNLFSNVAIYNNGHLTSRAANISTTFENMANNVFWNDRDIWERTHLYFQLYQFFHILGNKSDFYPELFKALRSDPMEHSGGTFISATDDYLKFYKKCCAVSGYDLTEFFQAYGFFVIPSLTTYVINNVTKDAYKVEDYANYYLTITQQEIDAAKQEVAAMNLPKANIIFIEDRISAPDATYPGAAGAKKTAFSNEYPIGQAGETGQYTDFGATCSAYKYNVTNNKVTMVGTGTVGFKVYDSTGNLHGLYNTNSFTLPDGIGKGYTVKAAAGNGTDVEATYDASIGIIVSDVTDYAGNATDAVAIGTQITSEAGITSGKAFVLKTGAERYITDNGTNYDVPNSANTSTKASTYFLISNGDGTWKIKNYATGKYWGVPAYNTALASAEEAKAGAWSLNFSGGIAYPSAPDASNTIRGIDRSSGKVWGWSTGNNNNHKVYIYEADLTSIASDEFEDKDIRVSSDAAASLQTNQWYVMFDRGANHGYLYENNSNQLYNTATAPSGSATSNAKYLVRIVGWDNEYYLQTGLGNFFGNIQQSTTVPTTATATEKITIKKIADTDGHFYLMSAAGVVLDANSLENGDATVVGWGTTAPTSTGGNNDWAFYPVEFVDSWIPTTAEVYTINNTNTSRGAMMYNGSSDYVWSSGKSGTFSATDPNCQWVLVSAGEDNQYYIYNVGAGRFAIPSGTNSTASWVFSSDAVAITLIKQNDGTFKIKTVKTDTYAAVSNGYAGPIINYNDIGGNFTITKVDGDQSAAATAAFNKLIKNQTLLTAVPDGEGWYAIRIKSGNYAGEYVYAPENEIAYASGRNYPLTFMNAVNKQPAIDNTYYLTRIVKTANGYAWILPNGKYLCKSSSNYFPTSTTTPVENVSITYNATNGMQFIHGGYKATPYYLSSKYFIGETSNVGGYFDVYPVSLNDAGLTAWQVLCENAPETAQIRCTRNDVSGLTTVYKNGYIFLPANVTPESSDFVLDGAIDASVDADAKTITLNYNPDLAIVKGGVVVAQGWQTASRGGEVMLLKVDAAPFRDATGVSISLSLKDGSEANISKLTLYEASSNSPEILSAGNDGAPTKTSVAEANVSGATASFSIASLAAGNHYYWVGATVKDDAALGAVLDAAVTSITYTCNNKETTLDLTAVGDPADRGAMVFNVHSYPFLPRDNGSRVYRIPAMVVADDGSIVVAADKRYQSYTDIGNGGHVIDIVVRRSTDGGRTWSEPVTIAKGEGSTASGGEDKRCGYGDPSLVKGKDGKLYCLFAAGNEGYFYGQKGMCMSVSTDNGVTWSSGVGNPPVDLYWSGAIKNVATAGAAGFGLYDYFVTSGRGLYIPDDDILMYLIPAQTMTSATEHTGDSQDYIFYSRDGGESWYFSNIPMVQGGDEAKIIQMNDGSLFGSIRKGGQRRFNTATYTCNDDGKTLSFSYGTQWDNSQLTQSSQNNQDILYYQRETVTGKKDYIFHSITTGNHTNFKLYYSTDQGNNWTEFLNVQTKGTRYVTMDKSGTDENPGSLYLFFEDQSLNSAGGYTDYNHYPLNFIEITREQLLQYIPDLDKSALEKEVKIVYGTSGEATFGSWSGLTWTSNATSGVAGLTMTLSDGTNNKFSNFNSRYNLAYHPAAANTNSTITLTAPTGYVITGYSVQTGVYQASTYTLTAEDGTSVIPANLGSTYTPLEVSGLSAASTAITVTTTDASKWLSLANFTVTIQPIITLDETEDMASTISANDGKIVNVTLNRKINKGFNSVVLPFDLNAAQVQTLFGEDTKVYAYSEDSDDANNVTVKFKTVTDGTIAANQPVLVEATAASTENLISNVIITYEEEPKAEGRNIDYVGLYAPSTVPEGDYFISKGAIYKSEGSTSIKSFRAYLKAKTDIAGVKLFIDDIETGITSIDNGQLTSDNAAIYNLAGQRLNKVQKGINIVNGKKVVIK